LQILKSVKVPKGSKNCNAIRVAARRAARIERSPDHKGFTCTTEPL